MKDKMKKNKKLIIILSSIIILSIIAFILIILLTTSELDKKIRIIDKSLNKTNEVITLSKIKDKDVLIYEYENIVTVNKKNAHITTNIKKLSDKFILEDYFNEERTKTISKKELLPFLIDNKTLKKYSVKENCLVCIISNEEFKEMIKVDDTHIKGNVTVTISFNNNLLSSISLFYITTSNKNVDVNISYKY